MLQYNLIIRGGYCTLLVTTCDASYSFAMCGLNIIGREKYGVFRLVCNENLSLEKIPKFIGLE